MSKILVVLKKELKDNFRDKRSLFFALLYGPLLLPVLMIGPLAIGVQKVAINHEQAQTIYIDGLERVPGLVRYLKEQNVDAEKAPKEYRELIKSHELTMALVVPEEYNAQFRSGKTASLLIYFDSANDASARLGRHMRYLLDSYSRQLAMQRLQVRGIDTRLLRPIHVVEEDMNLGKGPEQVIARILPFIIVLSLTLGGFYLAVDTTAGERERHSLEPLLSLSISRNAIALGKYLSILFFVAMSGLLATVSTYVIFAFVPVAILREIVDVQWLTFVKVFLIFFPLVLLFSSAMMLIASYARNTKEAQTHLGVAMFLPMAPFFILQFMTIQNFEHLYWLPVMSQFILVEHVLIGDVPSLVSFLKSIVGSLIGACVLMAVVFSLLHRENVLEST